MSLQRKPRGDSNQRPPPSRKCYSSFFASNFFQQKSRQAAKDSDESCFLLTVKICFARNDRKEVKNWPKDILSSSSWHFGENSWTEDRGSSRQPNRDRRLNWACIELWNSLAIGPCNIAPPVLQEPMAVSSLPEALGPAVTSLAPSLGNTLVGI